MSYSIDELRDAANATRHPGRRQVILDIISKPQCGQLVTVLTEAEENSIEEALKEKRKPMSS